MAEYEIVRFSQAVAGAAELRIAANANRRHDVRAEHNVGAKPTPLMGLVGRVARLAVDRWGTDWLAERPDW